MWRALMCLNLYGREAVRRKLKNSQKFLVFFGHFWAYVRQPHSHIGWARSMPFTSFNPTNPRTNPVNFHKKILRIGDFDSFFSKKKKNCFIPMKISPNLYGRMDGSKVWCFPWFPENSLLCVILCYTVYVYIWLLTAQSAQRQQKYNIHMSFYVQYLGYTTLGCGLTSCILISIKASFIFQAYTCTFGEWEAILSDNVVEE